MGFKLQRKSYKLTFGDGTALEGATVVMGGMTLAEAKVLESHPEDPTDRGQVEALFEEKLRLMASRLKSWDLEDDEGELPCTAEGLKRLELGEMLELQRAWGAAVSTVSAPLPNASSAGETQTLEVSIPMETLPPSQAS